MAHIPLVAKNQYDYCFCCMFQLVGLSDGHNRDLFCHKLLVTIPEGLHVYIFLHAIGFYKTDALRYTQFHLPLSSSWLSDQKISL